LTANLTTELKQHVTKHMQCMRTWKMADLTSFNLSLFLHGIDKHNVCDEEEFALSSLKELPA